MSAVDVASSMLETVDELVSEVVAPAADSVDAEARFPAEAIAALAGAGLLSVGVPESHGGPGLDLRLLAQIARRLGRGCGSTAMIWAMHEVQAATIAAATDAGSEAGQALARVAAKQELIASVTSEAGIGGNLRQSRAPVVESGPGTIGLEKTAPTVSYGEAADAYLITARRDADSAADDQVVVFADRRHVELEALSRWDPMGMRGTQSPGFVVRVNAPRARVLDEPFGTLALAVMVPWSHVLWASAWLGIAQQAFTITARAARKRGREDSRLAEAARLLTQIDAAIDDIVGFAERSPGAASPTALARYNDLKISASLLAVDAIVRCLEAGGMAAYQERGPSSVTRALRDLYSARLMIDNDRLVATNAAVAALRWR